ncbi:MAG: type II toxin-antitoxin system HicA family toxin [Candidatus Portnoybacteria bacterium]|nr:type II toxin-antitoxin system HicA family toxin [Candidatus Portnoybacteria bacterium]
MPSHSQLPGEIKRNKLLKALKRIGFKIDTTGGKGSHYIAVWPPTGKQITIQQNLRKDVLSSILKEIEKITNKQITWEDIKKEL